MTESTLSITDAYGQVRTDFSEAEVASLPPARRELLLGLLQAVIEARDAEQEATDAVRAQADAVVAEQRAIAAHNKAHPPRSRLDEMKAMGMWHPPTAD